MCVPKAEPRVVNLDNFTCMDAKLKYEL